MPGNFLNIDTEFPSLTGKEKSEDVIPVLMNYLSLLVEQLRYTLKNLDTSNFNSKALSDWEATSTQDVVDQVTTLTALVNQMSTSIGNLASRMGTAEGAINDLDGRLDTAEGDISTLISGLNTANGNITSQGQRITALETWKAGAANDISGLRTDCNQNAFDIAALGSDVSTLISEMAQLKVSISVNTAGDAVFGKAGQRTDIVGTVYINGSPVA